MSSSNSKWTVEEIGCLEGWRERGDSIQFIAKALGRTPKAVERKLAKLTKKEKAWLRPVLDAAREAHEAAVKQPDKGDYWREQYKVVRKMLEDERWRKTEVDALIEQVQSLAPLSYQTAPDVCWPKRKAGHAQSAVLLLSDTHVGQVVEPDQTLGFGGYNIDTFLARLKRLEQAVHSILSDHVTTPVEELVVPLLGDLIHGNLEHSVEAGQRHTLFEQFYVASHAIAQFLRNVSALVPKVRVYSVPGNHPRWSGTQKKSPTDNKYSNLDSFCAAMIQALVRDVPKIAFTLDKQPFAMFQVQGYQFFAAHGDILRGGDKALGIPAHSIGRHISSSMGLCASANMPLVNYYLFGHLHRPTQLCHTRGEILVNGGFPGIDGYGLSEGFQASPPSQRFFLMHAVYGKAASYDLRLDFPPSGDAPYYDIPKVS
jgi:hypothetical protein